jgi:hypothetical protein
VLVQNKAVFGGLVERDFVSGKVASVSLQWYFVSVPYLR